MPKPIAPNSSRTYRPRLALAAPEFGIPYLVEAEILSQKHHGRHSHREYQLIFVVEGAMGMEIDAAVHNLPAGSACLLRPEVVHKVVEPTGGSERALIIDLRLMDDVNQQFSQFVRDLPGGPAYQCNEAAVTQLADALRQAAESMTRRPAKLLACVWGLLSLIESDSMLFRFAGPDQIAWQHELSPRLLPRNTPADPRLAEAEKFMLDHLAHPIGVDQIAQAAGLSRSQLTRLYLAASGVAPATRLRTLRVDRARQLLLTSTLSVKEVARVCGFPSQNHFSRVYTQTTGKKPTEER